MRNVVLVAVAVSVFLVGCGPDDSSVASGVTSSDGGTSAACVDTWASYGASFFSSNCQRCHAGYATHSTVQYAAGQFSSAIGSGQMPRGTTLSATERTRVLTYLSCGAR